MAIEHSAIPDAQLHEVKGAAGASNRQILVANGAGSTTFQDNSMTAHAEMAIINNVIATAVPAATDTTLNTDSDYRKITAGWTQTHGAGIVFNVDELQVPVDGHYHFQFWATLKVPLINNFVGVKYAVNDTPPYSLQKIKSQSVTANDYRNLFATGYAALNANDTVSLYLAGTKADNLVVEEAGLVMYLGHEV